MLSRHVIFCEIFHDIAYFGLDTTRLCSRAKTTFFFLISISPSVPWKRDFVDTSAPHFSATGNFDSSPFATRGAGKSQPETQMACC